MRRGLEAYRGWMRITISISNHLLSRPDALAGRLEVSRDELYTTAIAEFVAKHQDSEVTARLDALYADEPSALNPIRRRAQGRSIRQERG